MVTLRHLCHETGNTLRSLPQGGLFVTVPIHGSKDIPIGTLYNIVVRQAGLSPDEFNEL